MLIGLVAGACLLLAAHEYLAAPRPGGSHARASAWLRRGVLVVLLAVLALAGDMFGVRARLQAPFARRVPPPAVPFDGTGDPLLARAVTGQAPAHPFPTTGTPEAKTAWREARLQEVRRLADYPGAAGEAVVERGREEVVDDVRRTLVRVRAGDGTMIPAYVHAPVRGGRGAAVLVIPGHGLGIRGTAGLVEEYQHAAAFELARAGYVTLTPELRGFGALARDGAPMHRAVAFAALEAGTFYKAVVARDLAVALSALQQWPGVDAARIGVAGASLGGELAVFLGVLDERIKVVVSQSYGGAAGPVSEAPAADEADVAPHGCHTIPGINGVLWQEDWFRLLAPRPVLVARGRTNTPRESGAFEAAVAAAYESSVRERFRFTVEAGDHEFFVESARRFLDTWL